jgi:hypothetical protein
VHLGERGLHCSVQSWQSLVSPCLLFVGLCTCIVLALTPLSQGSCGPQAVLQSNCDKSFMALIHWQTGRSMEKKWRLINVPTCPVLSSRLQERTPNTRILLQQSVYFILKRKTPSPRKVLLIYTLAWLTGRLHMISLTLPGVGYD